MKRGRIKYSCEEMGWLEENRLMVISDYHAGFVAAFDRSDITATHLHALRKRKGWKVGREGSRYKGRRKVYTEAEISFIANRADWLRVDLHRAFIAEFARPGLSLPTFKSLCKREGLLTGRSGRFVKGQEPANKGKSMTPETKAKCLPTTFKKGNRPHTYRGAGHESIDPKDGYVWLIVAETNPYTGAPTRRVQKHRWIWEQANGPIPKKHVLKCLDGDKTNCDPSNWEAIPSAMLPKLNGRWTKVRYDEAPADLKPTIMAIARLDHAARDARKAAK